MARHWYAAAALLAVLPLTGCTDDEKEPASMGPTESTAPKPDADADLAVTVEPGAVRVSWRLANTGSTPLLVVDRVPVPSGAGLDWRTDTAYVTGEGDGVRLSQQVFDWPDTDKTWEVAPRVGVTELPAGQALEREVVVPLPLEARHPFGDGVGDAVPADPGSFRFCLGVIAPPYLPALSRRPEDGQDTVNHGNVPWDSQYVFCSEPTALGG